MQFLSISKEEYGIIVKVKSKKRTVEFFVQLVDSEFRSDLGCWITTNESDGDLNPEDYPDFDISEIIEYAEKFDRQNTEMIETDFKFHHESIYIEYSFKNIQLVIENSNFINSDQSSYQTRYEPANIFFDTIEEAFDYLKETDSESLDSDILEKKGY